MVQFVLHAIWWCLLHSSQNAVFRAITPGCCFCLSIVVFAPDLAFAWTYRYRNLLKSTHTLPRAVDLVSNSASHQTGLPIFSRYLLLQAAASGLHMTMPVMDCDFSASCSRFPPREDIVDGDGIPVQKCIYRPLLPRIRCHVARAGDSASWLASRSAACSTAGRRVGAFKQRTARAADLLPVADVPK